jgi:hypothetical protein
MMFGLGRLPITLTRMIAHGHGDEAFAQYSNELWPNDLNFMIGLLLRLFYNLEMELVRESWVLFEFEPQNTFFQQILQGSSHCLNALKPTDKIVGVKPLLRKLLLQMDNCVKDNKNCHMLAFLSLLIVWEVFEKVQLGFFCSWAHT